MLFAFLYHLINSTFSNNIEDSNVGWENMACTNWEDITVNWEDFTRELCPNTWENLTSVNWENMADNWETI